MLPAAAHASAWPLAGGGAERSGEQRVEPGALPARVAWSFGGEAAITPPVISDGADPSAQRVSYGTADGRVHLRRLDTGEEVGNVLVADAAVTDRGRALGSAFGSSDGVLFVVHDDGGGVEIARIVEATGKRLAGDVAVPGSFGCNELGAPLLTPTAADGSRLLFFTMAGSCSAGSGLVRYGVSASGELTAAGIAPIGGLGFASPAFVAANGYSVAVARAGGVEVRRALADLGEPPDAVLPLPAGETPVAVAGDAFQRLFVLTAANGDSRVHRLALDGASAPATTPIAGAPLGLAITADRVAVSTDALLAVLTDALTVVGASPGRASAPSISGRHAFTADRAVSLDDASSEPLAGGARVAPAIARGLVSYGAQTLETRDLTPPAIVPERNAPAATVADDRGLARVAFRAGRLRALPTKVTAPFAPALYALREGAVPPGRWPVRLVATDRAGNTARQQVGVVDVGCGRRLRGGRGSDVLRGGRARDCVAGRGGSDRILVAGGGADSVTCGPGRDSVRADPFDHVADDCNRVRRHRP